MNKFIKMGSRSFGILLTIFGSLLLEKVLDVYNGTAPSPYIFIIILTGLMIYFYNRD